MNSDWFGWKKGVNGSFRKPSWRNEDWERLDVFSFSDEWIYYTETSVLYDSGKTWVWNCCLLSTDLISIALELQDAVTPSNQKALWCSMWSWYHWVWKNTPNNQWWQCIGRCKKNNFLNSTSFSFKRKINLINLNISNHNKP